MVYFHSYYYLLRFLWYEKLRENDLDKELIYLVLIKKVFSEDNEIYQIAFGENDLIYQEAQHNYNILIDLIEGILPTVFSKNVREHYEEYKIH